MFLSGKLRDKILGLFFTMVLISYIIVAINAKTVVEQQNTDCTGLLAYNCYIQTIY